jgi:hypothetical protein
VKTADACTGQVLAAQATCGVHAAFAPTSTGQKTASLSATATEGGAASATLTGTGVAPANLNIAPASRNFANVPLGQQSAAQVFTVTNNGGAPSGNITMKIVSGSNSDFSWTNDLCSGTTLAAGASCTLSVSFKPTTYGAQSATLSASATPGGTASANLTGNTPDAFVSTTGDDTKDGLTPTTAVRTITKGVAIAQEYWTVHVQNGLYGTGETYPIGVSKNVTVLGDTSLPNKPKLSPDPASPATIIALNAQGAALLGMEIAGSTSVTGSYTKLVSIGGSGTKIEYSVLGCSVAKCVAVSISGSGSVTVNANTIQLGAADTVGIEAGTGPGAVTITGGSVTCTGSPITNAVGVLIHGPATVTGVTVSECGAGLVADKFAELTMRGCNILDSVVAGVVVEISDMPPFVPPDLGTSLSAGNNTIRATGVPLTSVGLRVKTGVLVSAAGNTWRASTQGSDTSGHYATKLINGPVAGGAGDNYDIDLAAGAIQF